jgi:hypothetical protein
MEVIERVIKSLEGIYHAAGGITGDQRNHMIAMAILNEAQGALDTINNKAVEPADGGNSA